MSTTHGNDGRVKIGAAIIAHITSWSFERSVALAQRSGLGASHEAHNAGMRTGTVSIDCYLDQEAGAQQGGLVEGAELQLDLYPANDDPGALYFEVPVIVESVSNSVSTSDNSSLSVRARTQGAWTETALP